jgi:hypothetical protein
MSKGGALVRFHDWRAARDHKAVTRHFWRCRCIGLVAVPVSIGLATLVLPVGTSPFCTRRLHSDRFSARDRFRDRGFDRANDCSRPAASDRAEHSQRDRWDLPKCGGPGLRGAELDPVTRAVAAPVAPVQPLALTNRTGPLDARNPRYLGLLQPGGARRPTYRGARPHGDCRVRRRPYPCGARARPREAGREVCPSRVPAGAERDFLAPSTPRERTRRAESRGQ